MRLSPVVGVHSPLAGCRGTSHDVIRVGGGNVEAGNGMTRVQCAEPVVTLKRCSRGPKSTTLTMPRGSFQAA